MNFGIGCLPVERYPAGVLLGCSPFPGVVIIQPDGLVHLKNCIRSRMCLLIIQSFVERLLYCRRNVSNEINISMIKDINL